MPATPILAEFVCSNCGDLTNYEDGFCSDDCYIEYAYYSEENYFDDGGES